MPLSVPAARTTRTRSITSCASPSSSVGRSMSVPVSAALSATDKVAVYTDNGVTFIGYATLNADRTAWAITDTKGYSDSWTYTARVVDAAGNEGAVQRQDVTVDPEALAPYINGVKDSTSTSISSGG